MKEKEEKEEIEKKDEIKDKKILKQGKKENNDIYDEDILENEGDIKKTIGIKNEIIGPKIKKRKENKIEDKLLQIACEDKEERKERLKEEKKERQIQKLKRKEEELKNKNIIFKIDEDNYNCVDCGKEKSKFLSINNGVTLCDNCAQEHRLLGNCISYIIDINDKLDEYLFNFIVFGSNTRFKRFLEKEKVEKKLSISKKYKTNAVYYYRKLLKNKVEGIQLPEKDYEDPNEIITDNKIDEFSEFNKYIIKDQIIIKGEFKKESKLKSIINKIKNFSIKNNKKNNTVIILRSRSSIREILKKEVVKNNEEEDVEKVEKKEKVNVSKKKPSSLTFDNDKLKESSRPIKDDKTDREKTEENEDTRRASNEKSDSGNNDKR